MNPTVSVVIPCFNHGQYLDDAVSSALEQSWPDVEVVVVDDGSDDPATVALLRDYARPRTRVLRLPHGGLARARNAGIAAASGHYFCALDADDVLEPNYFEKAVSRLENDSSLTFVSCWLQVFGDEQWSWTPTRCDLVALLAECTVCTGAVVRLPAIRAVGGFDEKMPHQGHEDWDLWITLVERGYRGEIIPEFLFRYRRVPGSMSAGMIVPDVHRPLMEYLVRKHADSYERHMADVLALQDEDIGGLLRRNHHAERRLAAHRRDEIQGRREEVARLGQRRTEDDVRRMEGQCTELMARVHSLEHDLRICHEQLIHAETALVARGAEVEALRQSKSWRVTRPLRAGYDLWLAVSRRRGASMR